MLSRRALDDQKVQDKLDFFLILKIYNYTGRI